MSWLASLAIAFLAAIVGAVASGFAASLAVGWYRITSFEGASGYLVVGMALVGAFGGAVIALVVARTYGQSGAGGAQVLGAALLSVLAAVGGVAGVARALADVAPTVDGEALWLAVEVRGPVNGPHPATLGAADEGFARLGSATGARVVRATGAGILFLDDARQVDGRWVTPGIASIFTSRGEPILTIGVGDTTLAGFIVPARLVSAPNDTAWSEWLPRSPDGTELSTPEGWSYRARTVTTSEPIRREEVGAFTVETSVYSLFGVTGSTRQAANSSFRVSHRGTPVAEATGAREVAVIPGDRPALLALLQDDAGNSRCLLLVDEGESVAAHEVRGCGATLTGMRLTADQAAWESARTDRPPPGWLNRASFAVPGLYRLRDAILDSRTLEVTFTPAPDDPSPINGLAPVSLSPDERSYAWFAHVGDDRDPVLAVTDWRAGTTFTVPIDRDRMRFYEYERDIHPRWVAHHFEWRRETTGEYRLAPRASFTPLPYRGKRSIDERTGQVSAYYLAPGGRALRAAMVDMLVRELGGTRAPDELNGYHQVVRFGEHLVKGAVVEGAFVSFSMDYGKVDGALMARVADALEAAAASGKYDALFRYDEPETGGGDASDA